MNSIIDAISVKLFETFGHEYTIYKENVEQGLKEPCFFIDIVSVDRKQIIGNRYYSNNAFDICYFPIGEEKKADMLDVANVLYDDLEYVSLANGDLLKGTKMNAEIVDGILHFFVSYNLILQKETELAEDMEFLDVRTAINSEVQ